MINNIRYSGQDNSHITDSVLNHVYDGLPLSERKNIDTLCVQMAKKRPIRNMGIKAYREVLFKLYTYLSNRNRI